MESTPYYKSPCRTVPKTTDKEYNPNVPEQGPLVFMIGWVAIALLALSYIGPRDCAYKTATGKLLFTVACAATISFIGMPAGGQFIYFQF